MAERGGKLYIVGTPIGNLEDVALRALRVLKEVDLVAAEDTRRTKQLLDRYDTRKPLVSYHEFNEAARTTELLQKLRTGSQIALVSDAGMPTVSDPGRRLIHAAAAAGIPVEVVPGPSAVTAAIALCHFETSRFLFHGFLPHKGAQRRKALAGLAPLPFALVFYESPYRTVATLTDMREALGDRPALVARELTKKFEELLRGTLTELIDSLSKRTVKGEITIAVEGNKA